MFKLNGEEQVGALNEKDTEYGVEAPLCSSSAWEHLMFCIASFYLGTRYIIPR